MGKSTQITNDKQPIITVILPVYNAEKYLAKCIESVLNQTYSNLELIVINDGSTDGSKKIIERYVQEDPRVCLIDKTNSGQSICRGIAFEKSKGQYIYFIDSDDYMEPSGLQSMLASITKYNADFCCCRRKMVDESGKIINVTPLFEQECIEGNFKVFSNAIKANIIKSALWTKMFRKEFLIINKIGPLTQIKLHDDCMLTFLSSIYADRVSFTNNIVYNVLTRTQSLSRKCNPIMVSVYNNIFYIVKEHLHKVNKWDEYEIPFFEGYLKSILYTSILTAIKSADYKSYLRIAGSVIQDSMFEINKIEKAAKNKMSFNILFHLYLHPRLFYIISHSFLKYFFSH